MPKYDKALERRIQQRSSALAQYADMEDRFNRMNEVASFRRLLAKINYEPSFEDAERILDILEKSG